MKNFSTTGTRPTLHKMYAIAVLLLGVTYSSIVAISAFYISIEDVNIYTKVLKIVLLIFIASMCFLVTTYSKQK